jgi:hypothetical protein
MQHYLSRKDRLFVMAAAVCLLSVSAAGWFLFPALLPAALTVASTVFLVFYLLQLYRRLLIQLEQQRDTVIISQMNHYAQVEAALSLSLPLQPEVPLPTFRGWAASPDFLLETVREVNRLRPDTVLETGSGASTIIIGLYLKKAGRGKLISLEHSAEYFEKTRAMLELHGLEGTVELVHAPLTDVTIEGEKWKWYDLKKAELPERIDLIVVDGPPENIQKEARFPAVPLLKNHIGGNAVILVDDGRREGEKKAVERWLGCLPGFTMDYLPLEKGAFRVHRPAGNETGDTGSV